LHLENEGWGRGGKKGKNEGINIIGCHLINTMVVRIDVHFCSENFGPTLSIVV